MLNLNILPHSPGCYLYKDKDGKIIYIAKCKRSYTGKFLKKMV